MTNYIGRGIDQIDNISTLDNLSFNGSSATFNLTQNSVAFTPVSADALQIQIDGIIQSGNYSVANATVTFDFTPSGSSVCNGIKHFGVGVLTSVSDGAVTQAKLGADSVNGSKIADNSIDSEHYVDGSIDLAHLSSQSVDEDNLYISNAGTNGQFLSKQSGNTGGLTWADAGGTNTPVFAAYLSDDSDQSISDSTTTKIQFDAERIDTAGAFDTTNYKFVVPSGQAGKYFIVCKVKCGSSQQNDIVGAYVHIYKNGATYHSVGYTGAGFISGTKYPILGMGLLCSTVIDLAVGDYIEGYGYIKTNGSGTPKFQEGNDQSTWIEGFKLL